MNKKIFSVLLVVLVIILVGVVFWQNKQLKIKNDIIKTPVVNKVDDKNLNTNNKVVTPKKSIKKVVVAPKDEVALKENFTYEIPLNKILGKKWVWVKSINYDETAFTPKNPDAFSLTFKDDGTFSGTTDCNTIFGKYTSKNNSITLSSLGQTMMYCEGSEEIKFTSYLNQVIDFKYNSDEHLVLNFEFNSGAMIFK